MSDGLVFVIMAPLRYIRVGVKGSYVFTQKHTEPAERAGGGQINSHEADRKQNTENACGVWNDYLQHLDYGGRDLFFQIPQ